MEDKIIISEIINGNIEAYSEIIKRYESKLIRYVTYLIHDNSAAVDIVQDTFIKIYQNLNNYNNKYKFSSWAYRIAHNETINAIKKTKHFTDDEIEDLEDYHYNTTTAEKIDSDIFNKDVQKCIMGLKPKYREVIQLIYFENMKYEEISDILHIPTSTVGVWLSRAKKFLKKICLEKGLKR